MKKKLFRIAVFLFFGVFACRGYFDLLTPIEWLAAVLLAPFIVFWTAIEERQCHKKKEQ